MIEQALSPGSATSPASAAPAWTAADALVGVPDGLARLRRLAARLAGHPEALDLLGDIDAITRELEARQLLTERLSFLSEASELLDSPAEVGLCLARVARLAVPCLADTCVIYLLDEKGVAHYAASAHADARREALLEAAARGLTLRRGGALPPECALDTGRPVLLADVAPELFADGVAPEIRTRLAPLAPSSWLAVPLRHRGRSLGVLSLMLLGRGRCFAEDDLELAHELADRVALSVENGLLLRQAEETRAQLDALFRSTPVALALLDRELRYVRVNDAASALLGRPLEALVGRSVLEVGPELSGHLESVSRRLMASHLTSFTTEISGTPPGRSEPGHWLVTLYAVRTAAGKCIGIGAAVVDITARKDAELAAQAAKEVAEAASLAKSQFLAVMSHELRTPLTTVIGYADLLMGGTSGPVAPRQRDQLARIKTSAWNLVGIIEEILTFSRADAGKEKAFFEVTDVAALAREAAETIEPQARGAGLAFRAEGLGGIRRIVTDGGKIRQILMNLLGNAVKFTESGAVELELAEDAQGGCAFHVRDTGPGIAARDQELIFEPFRQLDQSSTRQQGGTGLGLTVSRQLARLLGGDVTVASTPGMGSTFTLRIPARGTRQSAASITTSAVPSGV